MARQQGRGRRAIAEEAGAARVAGASWNAAVALDWDAPGARQPARPRLLDRRTAVAQWRDTQPVQAEPTSHARARLAGATQGCAHDLPPAPDGTRTLRQGVAAERRLRGEEAARRQGQQRRRLRLDGSQRHGRRAWDRRRSVAVGVTPAHVPEARGPDALAAAWAAQQGPQQALHLARAYLARALVPQRPETLTVCCPAWPGQQGSYCAPNAFHLAWEGHPLRGPGGERLPLAPGEGVQCPAATCARCALRERCTTRASGRRVTSHPDEALWHERRARQQTPQGRAKLRERVAVEHALAHVGRWQGRRARYRGMRNKVFDLRRCAVVHHVHVLTHLREPQQQAA